MVIAPPIHLPILGERNASPVPVEGEDIAQRVLVHPDCLTLSLGGRISLFYWRTSSPSLEQTNSRKGTNLELLRLLLLHDLLHLLLLLSPGLPLAILTTLKTTLFPPNTNKRT